MSNWDNLYESLRKRGLSVRAAKALLRIVGTAGSNEITRESLSGITWDRLHDVANCGPATRAEIREALAVEGILLKGDPYLREDSTAVAFTANTEIARLKADLDRERKLTAQLLNIIEAFSHRPIEYNPPPTPAIPIDG